MDDPMTYPSATGMVSDRQLVPGEESVGLTGNTISRIDDYTSERSLIHFGGRPRRGEGENSLDSDVPEH